MSPTYSLTLVLAVTLFLTATSLIDVPNHQPSATFTFKNELRKPVPPQKGGGHNSIGQANKYDPKSQKEPSHPGSGHHSQLHINEEAVDKESIPKPAHPHDPHANEKAVNKNPTNKPGHPHDPRVNEEFTYKPEGYPKPIHKPGGPHDPYINEGAVNKKPINKPGGPHNPLINAELNYKLEAKPSKNKGPGGPHDPHVNEAVNKKSINKPGGPHDPNINVEKLVNKPKPKPGHTDVFVEKAKGNKGDDRDKRGGHHGNVETAKEKYEHNKPRTGN